MEAPLVRAARSGSQAAFARLVALHEKPLRGFLRKSGWMDADDIAQEAFVAAWTSLGRLRADEGFRAWLYGIAWRKALDQRRATRRSSQRDEAWRELVHTSGIAASITCERAGCEPPTKPELDAVLATL